ncbi:MAG: histidinol-phosphatase [Flavobacteriales bacterium]|nr:histidinol-phosphatase [Flavobacteriales bacterium]MCX7768110.1 histidinol-phosphatase [Flavobacteriales bacterium]MDW8409598.1 histidinol-phosphatase [Flavobacteriales bacterium]
MKNTGWKGNLHGHCYYCDGMGSPEEYVERALELGHAFIGFSSHVPLARHNSPWNMAAENFYKYLNHIQDLRRQYEGKIEIYCGFEMDDPYSLYTTSELCQIYEDMVSYTIGSVHYVGELPDGSLWQVDGSTEEFLRGVEELCNGSVEAAVGQYFNCIKHMLTFYQPTILGHVDKILIHPPVQQLLRIKPEFFRKRLEEIFALAKRQGTVVEINTRGLYSGRYHDYYPSRQFWPLLKVLETPVVVHSDCHAPQELDALCHKAWETAYYAGLRIIAIPQALANGPMNGSSLSCG